MLRLLWLLGLVVALVSLAPTGASAAEKGDDAIAAFKAWLARPAAERPKLAAEAFARKALSKVEADQAEKLLWADLAPRLQAERSPEMERKVIRIGDKEMPFAWRTFGEKPAAGRSLYISMHGGGGAPKRINDSQWENQKRLYEPAEGIYVAPRAPTDTWDLWHQGHIDSCFERLIDNFVVCEGVNPDRVYLMGYSAGGDGVYQIAPRMADRFAAASMMAGHPNEASPLGLRNLPFSIHVGASDGGYGRNTVAKQWGEKLDKLRAADPQGYEHWTKLYEGKGHWMDREDAAAIPWMAKFTRNAWPPRVVWFQDDVTHERFYWLAVPAGERRAGAEATASVEGASIEITAQKIERLKVRFHDHLLDLDKPITITAGGKTRFQGSIPRTIAAMNASLAERADPRTIFRGEVEIDVK